MLFTTMFNFIKSIVRGLVGGQVTVWKKEGYSCEEEWMYSEQCEEEEEDKEDQEKSWKAQEISSEWYDVGTRFWDYFHQQQRYEIQCIPDVWEYENMVGVGNPFDVEDLNF